MCFFFKQKTAYEMRISDWSSDVCSSDLLVAAGMNPMDLKRGIDLAVDEVVKDIARQAKKVKSSEEIAQVGTVAANGEKAIGDMIAKAMQKVGNEGVITVEAAKSLESELEVVEGMQFGRRSEEHTSEIQSLMRISYAVICL